MRKIIAFTSIAFAIGVIIGWTAPMLAVHPALGYAGASAAGTEPAEASLLSPIEMMRRTGHLPVQAPSDPF